MKGENIEKMADCNAASYWLEFKSHNMLDGTWLAGVSKDSVLEPSSTIPTLFRAS